jgi:preprotein translocase subunit SecG
LNSLIITIHIIACITLVVLVLLQSGKEGMGVIFGGGGGSLFGASGAGNLLSKLTAGAATVFFITSMVFTYISTQQHTSPKESIVLDMPVTETPAAPVVPTEPAAPVDQNAQSETQPKTN